MELLPVAGHLIAYGSLAVALMVALERTGFEASRAAPLAVRGATLYGISDEFHQSFVPGRHADPFDLLVNAIGAGLTVLLLFWYRKRCA